MRRGPIRKEMQRARQGVRAAATPAEAADQVMRYWDAREQLAEVKGQESPEYCTEFEAGQ